ncbi:MAG: MerR family transcriptional regulator [Oscillospiraceae bacterium]|nr:MerR family transcriptional regulator [Oscillospiraceae bacterium]
MENIKAIPEGYMTVGEVAKHMNTTVRTLQYYHKEGILIPSAFSEGGRRLYSDKDIIKLHQIQSMKYLGFSLDDIKNRLVVLDTPDDVAQALTEQADGLREQIRRLSETLNAIEALKAEVLQIQSVDFTKYADIIINLQMKNEYYHLIKHFDQNTIEEIRSRFDQESGKQYLEMIESLHQQAIDLSAASVKPESDVGQEFAKNFWEMIQTFTEGDMTLLTSLIEFAEITYGLDEQWKQRQTAANRFIEPSLSIYLTTLGINPFEGDYVND